MEPVSLSIMAAAAGKALDVLLGDNANRLVSSILGGVIGNRADGLVCQATKASWQFFRTLRTEDPALNHDLERGTREAYLLATIELLRQAEVRVQQSGARLLGAGDAEALVALRRGAEADLRDVGNTLPEPLPDAHLFLIDPALAPADRLARMRQTLRDNLTRDTARWLPGRDVPTVVASLIESGWTIDTSFHKQVPRDWHSLVALAFVEKLKTTPRLATVFESKLLAQIALREPAAAPMARFADFSGQLDRVTVPLQRIEDQLDVVTRDVAEIKDDVKAIRSSLGTLGNIPRPAWLAVAALVVVGALGFATDAAPRLACGIPGVRAACGALGIGGVPSAAEATMWNARRAGDCSELRAYLTRYPSGAYAEEAGRRLAARQTSSDDRWTAEDRTHAFTVRSTLEPLQHERAAQADALVRAEVDARDVCAPYEGGEYRLRGSDITPRVWQCTTLAGGARCGFDGLVTCHVEVRRVDTAEVCN